MNSRWTANRLQTRRRQLCIKWRVDARWMPFHIRWTSKRKSATSRTMVLGSFDYRAMMHYKFAIRFKSELLLGISKTSTASRSSRSLVFAVCGVHGPIVHEHRWSGSGWLSRFDTAWVLRTSSKFHQAVMFALDFDQRQFSITGKVPQHHDGSLSVGISSLNTGRMEMLIGTFFDALRVRPIGPTWRGHLEVSFRVYQRFHQWLQLS